MLSLLLCSCRLVLLVHCFYQPSITLHGVQGRLCGSLGYGSELMSCISCVDAVLLNSHISCLVSFVYGVFQCPCMSVGMFLLPTIVS
jgi:hypothetical protein